LAAFRRDFREDCGSHREGWLGLLKHKRILRQRSRSLQELWRSFLQHWWSLRECWGGLLRYNKGLLKHWRSRLQVRGVSPETPREPSRAFREARPALSKAGPRCKPAPQRQLFASSALQTVSAGLRCVARVTRGWEGGAAGSLPERPRRLKDFHRSLFGGALCLGGASGGLRGNSQTKKGGTRNWCGYRRTRRCRRGRGCPCPVLLLLLRDARFPGAADHQRLAINNSTSSVSCVIRAICASSIGASRLDIIVVDFARACRHVIIRCRRSPCSENLLSTARAC
jgi:hypothetical protein